jgi:hypothetical protein
MKQHDHASLRRHLAMSTQASPDMATTSNMALRPGDATRLRTSNFDTDAAVLLLGVEGYSENPSHITNLTNTLPPQRNLTTSTEPNHGGFHTNLTTKQTNTPTTQPLFELTNGVHLGRRSVKTLIGLAVVCSHW